MALFIEAFALGVMSGSVYALMASGLTLIFGVMRIFNMAMGILVVLGAYLSSVLQQRLHIDLFVGLLVTIPVLFALGIGIERVCVRPITGRDRTMHSILVTFALALVIEGVLTFFFTTNYVQLQAPYLDATFGVAGFYFRLIDVFVFLLSVLLLAGLYFLVYRTRFGFGLRALMQDPTAAALIGIDVERVQSLTFGIGVALAAVGGVAFGVSSLFNPASSYDLIYRLIVIVVLGGLGSLRGALVASLLLLTGVSVVGTLWTDAYALISAFLLLICVLRFRPQGLFGQPEGRKQ